MTALIKDIVEVKQPYVVTYQKDLGMDRQKQKRVVENVQANCKFDLLVVLGNTGSFVKPRRVKVSHVSNGLISDSEYVSFRKNFHDLKLPLSTEIIARKERLIKQIVSGNLTEG
jgi:hypothetical protein